MELPVVFALSDLPLAGQHALAKHPDTKIREALATSSTTHIEVIDLLVKDGDPKVWCPALARTTNIDQILDRGFGMFNARFANSRLGHLAKMAACRNPLTPSGRLAQALTSDDNMVVLLALINPSTPLGGRQRLLTPDKAEHLTLFATEFPVDAEIRLRAFEIVNANPWMAENPDQWCEPIRFAIYDTWRKLNLASDTRLTYRDLQAMATPEFTLNNAVQILCSAVVPEPQIIGRLVNRYGLGALLTAVGVSRLWQSEEFYSASRIAPAIACVMINISAISPLTGNWLQGYTIAKQACKILGNSGHNWGMFTNILPDWHGDIITAALAACKL